MTLPLRRGRGHHPGRPVARIDFGRKRIDCARMAGKGGSIPGAGRKKGQKNKATIERELIAARQAEKRIDEAVNSGRKLGKDVLDDFMQLFAGIAASYQPVAPDVWEGMTEEQKAKRTPNPVEFEKWARLAVHCATKLAPYQSPTFQAIMIAPPPPDPRLAGQRKRFTLTIFEGAPPPPRLIEARKNGSGNGSDA
jgi:hypothetical protein